jgi:hypothetical protein
MLLSPDKISVSPLKYPWGNRTALALHFDDFSPFSVFGYDFGGHRQSKLNAMQADLLESTPVKITHFVVPCFNWWLPIQRIDKFINFPSNRFSLVHPRNRWWLDMVKDMISTGRVEIAWHGFRHFGLNPRGKQIEFLHTNYETTREKLNESHSIFETAGLAVRGFRQPGWGFNPDGNLFELLQEFPDIKYVASSGLRAGINANKQTVSDWEPEIFRGFVNIPQNITIGRELEDSKTMIDDALRNGHLISLKGHYCNVGYISNAVTVANWSNVKNIIEYLRPMPVWYATFYQVADWFTTIRSLHQSIEHANGTSVVHFKTSGSVRGFSVDIGFAKNRDSHEIVARQNRVELHANQAVNFRVVFESESSTYTIVIRY